VAEYGQGRVQLGISWILKSNLLRSYVIFPGKPNIPRVTKKGDRSRQEKGIGDESKRKG